MQEQLEQIKKYTDFFRDYRESFLKNCLRCLLYIHPDFPSQDAFLSETAKLFDYLFSFLEGQSAPPPVFEPFVRKGCDLRQVLAKAFFLLVHDFVEHAFSRETNLGVLQDLVSMVKRYEDSLLQIYARAANMDEGDPGEDEREILEVMGDMMLKQREFRLVSVFKDVPIWFGASPQDVGDRTATLSVHRYQIMSLTPGSQIFLESEFFPRTVSALVRSCHQDRLFVVVGGFFYADASPEKRAAPRVQPESPLSVQIRWEGKSREGKILNLSCNGVALELESGGDDPGGHPVSLHFQMPDEVRRTLVTLDIEARFLRRGGSLDSELIYTLNPDMKIRTLIARYVSHRQYEIIREMRQGSNTREM